jgi:hypothetical protein
LPVSYSTCAGGDGDAPRLLLRRLVDLVIGGELGAALLGEHLGDRRRQRGLAVIDVTDGPDVAMGLRPLELFLSHVGSPSFNTKTKVFCKGPFKGLEP